MIREIYFLASSKRWLKDPAYLLNNRVEGAEFILVSSRQELHNQLQILAPKKIFFIHWSYLIPREIYEKYECIIFHMTDVPFGRGGSPLQNLIERKIYNTKISALKCVKELDAGPVYLKRPLQLDGSAQNIYLTASKIILKMIEDIINTQPVPQPQTGEVTVFTRRKPEQSDLSQLSDIEDVFNWIRMLDADGYPKAFIETEYMHIEFTQADKKNDEVKASVTIRKKND